MPKPIRQGKSNPPLFDQFQKILDFNPGKGFCALVTMPGPPIMSALRLFREEFEEHAHTGTCRYGSPA